MLITMKHVMIFLIFAGVFGIGGFQIWNEQGEREQAALIAEYQNDAAMHTRKWFHVVDGYTDETGNQFSIAMRSPYGKV